MKLLFKPYTKNVFFLITFMFLLSLFSFSQNKTPVITTNNTSFITCHTVQEQTAWINLINTSLSSGTLIKIGGNNWNADAISTTKVKNYGSVSTVVNQTNYSRILGLNDVNQKRDYTDLNYGIMLKNNRQLYIFENGNNKGNVGQYQLNDTIKITVEDNQVKYYRNDLLLYTSATNYTTPLFVDCSLEKNGAKLSHVMINNITPLNFRAQLFNQNSHTSFNSVNYQWKLNGNNVGTDSDTYTNLSLTSNDKITCEMTHNSQSYTSNTLTYILNSHNVFTNFSIHAQQVSSSCFNSVQAIQWNNLQNVASANNTLTKYNFQNTWNAGASSQQEIHNYGGYIKITASTTNMHQAFGLNSSKMNYAYNQMKFCIYLYGNQVRVYESGNHKGTFGNYEAGDVFEIRVTKEGVKYYQNGQLLYLSSASINFPMIGEFSLYNRYSVLQDAYISTGSNANFFITGNNLGNSPTYQWKLNGNNIGANSSIIIDQPSNNDIISCELLPDIEGCQSELSSSIKLQQIDIKSFGDFYISNNEVFPACKDIKESITWTNIANVYYTSDNVIEKIQGGNNWYHGAATSLNTLTNGSSLQFKATERNKARIIGITTTNNINHYNSIDFSFFLRENGQLYIYENGQNKKSCGVYLTDDELKISIINQKVYYYHNKDLLYISSKVPTSSLVVDVSFNHVHSTLKDILITNGSRGSFTSYITDLGENPNYQWKLNESNVGKNSNNYTNINIKKNDIISCQITPDLVGCNTSSYSSENLIIQDKDIATLGNVFINYDSVSAACQHIETIISWNEIVDIQEIDNKIIKIQGGNNWNSGYAFSEEAIYNGGYLEFTITETNKKRAIGFSQTNQGTSYTSIEYLFFLNPNGVLDLYESNVKLGSFGNYETGDKLKISVEKNQVKYYNNEELLLISTQKPTLPMFVDVALYDLHSSLDQIKIGNGCVGNLKAQADFFLGDNPIYEWKLDDQIVGNNQDYVNTNLENNQSIICQITPDIDGCDQTKFESNNNVITFSNIVQYYSEFYIETEPQEQACKYTIDPVTWKYTDNIERKNNYIKKIQGGNSFNTGKATTYNKVYNGGYLEFFTQEIDKEKIIGLSLSSNSTSINSSDIDYAILLNSSGYYRIHEKGVSKDLFYTYVIGDKFKISIEKNQVKYYHNDELFYISQTSPLSNYPFIIQSIFKHVGGQLHNIKVANGTQSKFSAHQINMGVNPSYQWKLNGNSIGTNDNTYQNTEVVNNDIITCTIVPDIAGCSDQNVYTSPSSALVNRDININSSFYITNQRITGCKEAFENVIWKNTKGLKVDGNFLQKIQGENNWNIGSASSANTVNESGYMTFTASEKSTNRYIGLSSQDLDESINSIEYAFFLNNNGKFKIYEKGVPKATAFIDYEIGDRFKISIENGVVKYYYDGSLLYVSATLPITIPMLIEANIETKGGTLENVQIINTTRGNLIAHVQNLSNPSYQWVLDSQLVGNNQSNYDNNFIEDNQKVYCTIQPNLGGCHDVKYSSPKLIVNYIDVERFGSFYLVNNESSTGCKEALEHVTWTNLINIESNDNHNLEKIQGGYGWNAGATSYNHVRDGGYVYTVISEINKKRMIGLSTVSSTNADVAIASIDFALFPKSDQTLELYEQGVLLGTYGTYETGDTLKISVEKQQVKYYKNSKIIYISLKYPTFPMLVDVSMQHEQSTLKNVYVSNPTIGNFSIFTDRVGSNPIYEWRHNNNIVGGNQTTYSNPNVTDNDEIVCYLTPDLPGCHTTKYKSGTISTNNTNIIRYGEFHIENKPVDIACKEAFEIVSWKETNDVYFRKGYVQKIQKNDVWDGGASSYNKVYNNGYAFTVLHENNTDRVFGLSTVNSIYYPELDYIIYITNDQRLVIYESGIWKAEVDHYAVGDTISIKIDENVVKYYKNQQILYTSFSTPSYPLYVNVALRNSNAILKDIYVVNLTLGEFSTITTNTGDIISYKWVKENESVITEDNFTTFEINDVDAVHCTSTIKPSMGGCIDVEYTTHPILIKDSDNDHMFDFSASTKPSNNVCLTTDERPIWDKEFKVHVNQHNLTKDHTGSKWNAGAFSLNKINNNGAMQFIVSETNTYRAIGLSHLNTDHHFNTIEYGFYLKNNGSFAIFEQGQHKKEIGSYQTNDTLIIKIDNKKIKYFRNQELVYVSATTPTLPLSIDVSLYSPGSTLNNIFISNGTEGIFTAESFIDGTYYWEKNGAISSNNTNTYRNYLLEEEDMIYCEYTPDLPGCVRKILTNAIKIQEPISNNLVLNNTDWLGSQSTDWFNPDNWSDGVPHPSSVVTIPGNTSHQPEINKLGNAYSMHLENNASLTLNDSAANLRVFHDWINKGTFTANYGTVTFSSCIDDTIKIESHHLETYYNLVVNNHQNVKVDGGNQKILNNLTIASGIIHSPNDTIFIMDNATVSNVTDSTYIHGKVSKIGNDAFIFPVGDDTNYRPIEMSAPQHETDEFVATYCPVNPFLNYSNTISNTLKSVNQQEYWILDREHGTSAVNVTLYWNTDTQLDLNEIVCVSRFDSERWQNHGQAQLEGDITQGKLKTASPVTSFSPFTFGISNGVLPIKLINFKAIKKEEVTAITWTTTMEKNHHYFELQKSIDSENWKVIAEIDGQQKKEGASYMFLDEEDYKTNYYYRLKSIDYDGKYTYSSIIFISIESSSTLLFYPNPTTGRLNIQFDSEFEETNSNYHLQLLNSYGEVVKEFNLNEPYTSLDLSSQKKGVYFFKGSDSIKKVYQKIVIH